MLHARLINTLGQSIVQLAGVESIHKTSLLSEKTVAHLYHQCFSNVCQYRPIGNIAANLVRLFALSMYRFSSGTIPLNMWHIGMHFKMPLAIEIRQKSLR